MKTKGVTLGEALVVLFIICILFAVLAPMLVKALKAQHRLYEQAHPPTIEQIR